MMNFGLLVGSAYILFALLQAVVSLGLADIPLIPSAPVGVLVLLILGAVFLSGYRELGEGVEEGVAHIHVGILLSLIFGLLYLLILGADALEAYVIKNEDFADWTLIEGLRPELYLALLSLVGLYKWRDELSLGEILQSAKMEQR